MGAQGIRLPDRAFWDRYLTLLQAAGIKPDQARWYVLRVEQYLKAHPDLALADHGLGAFVRARRPRRLPVVLARAQVRALLDAMSGTHQLMARLMYGTGMRLLECVRLRIKDIDFDYRQIVIRDAKGGKDRIVPLPYLLPQGLMTHLTRVRELFDEDRAQGFGEVFLPDGLSRIFRGAARDWIWQYAFPSGRLSVDPRSAKTRRQGCQTSARHTRMKLNF